MNQQMDSVLFKIFALNTHNFTVKMLTIKKKTIFGTKEETLIKVLGRVKVNISTDNNPFMNS